MKLIINGEEKNFKDGLTIEEILRILEIRNKVMASAINMEIVKEIDWDKFQPKDGDKIEFLQFVGGGWLCSFYFVKKVEMIQSF